MCHNVVGLLDIDYGILSAIEEGVSIPVDQSWELTIHTILTVYTKFLNGNAQTTRHLVNSWTGGKGSFRVMFLKVREYA